MKVIVLVQDHFGRVLVVEDDEDVVRLLAGALQSARYQVESLGDGRQALDSVSVSVPDVIVMDVDLPGLDGLSLCREIRKFSDVPVLMLSVLRDDIDKIVGLELGADDYMGKPFNLRELVARVRALHRRSQSREATGIAASPPSQQASEATEWLQRGCLRINLDTREIEVAGTLVHLTATEFSLLQVLAQRSGRVFSRQELLDRVWGQEWVGTDRTVDVHLRRIRSKFLEHSPHAFIEAVRGIGYKLSVPVES